MGPAGVFERVREAAYRDGVRAEMASQIEAVIERKLAVYDRAPIWCVPELPRRTCRALGLPAALGDALAAACIVYHCAADIIDDAQDDDLAGNPAWAGDWRDAVTVGLHLLSAHGAMLARVDAPAEVRAAWAVAFGEAGLGLTVGQHRDLRALPDAAWTEYDVLALGREKAGAAVGAFMSLGAIAAGRSDVRDWRDLGATVGQMLQVASDLEAYLTGGPHPDLAQAKLTLPLLAARDADPDLAALWEGGLPLAAGSQQALRTRVRAAGGVMYARMRVEALKHEALWQIEGLGCPGLLEELLPILASAELDDEPVPFELPLTPARLSFAPAIWLPVAIALIAWAVVLGAALNQVGTVYPGFRVNRVATVWFTNEPHLPGIRAGLQPGDVVQRVDGVAVADGPAVRAAVRPKPAGVPVAYEVRRDGAPRPFTVPATPLGPLDFLVGFAVRFGMALATIAIGLAAASMRPDNRAARANLVFCLGWGLFTVLDVDFELTYLVHPALYYAAVLAYAAGALAMALNFPETPAWLARRPEHQRTPYLASFLCFVPIAAAFAIQGVPAGVALGEVIGLAWPSLVLLFGLGLFVRRLYRADNPRTRAQLQVLLLGLAVAYLPAALLANAPILLTGHAPPPAILAVTSALNVVFPLAIAYAIVRHGLFDIAILVKRTTTYAALTAFLIGGYFVAAGAIRWAAGLLGLAQGSDWQNALATALIAVLVLPVRTLIARTVDRLFFRTAYDFRAMVNMVTSRAQNTLDLDETKRTFMAVIDEALHPRFMYILTLEPGGKAMQAAGPTSVFGDAPDPALRVFLDDPLLTRVGSASEVEYVPATGLTGLLSPLAALGPHYRVPLQVGEDVVGLIVLGPKRSDQDYAAEDRELLAATRLPLATAIKTATLVDDRLFKDRIEQDLRRAREVQEAMLPAGLPAVPGYDFAASSVACYEASGDYYDFVELADGRLGVAVADVAGKGIAAALATAMAKSGLYNQTQTDPEVLPVLHALNRLLHAVTKRAVAKSFTTCCYAVLEPEARKLTYACAGHFPPLHWSARAGRPIEYAMIGGFPLGVRESSRYIAQDVVLGPGDVLIFFTDGVTEAQAPDDLPGGGDVEPGEQFESDRLTDVVRAHAGGSAQAIHDAVLAAVAGWVAGGPQTDDITLVVIKVQA